MDHLYVPLWVFCPEVITMTFDPDNRLLKVVQLLAGGHEIHFLE